MRPLLPSVAVRASALVSGLGAKMLDTFKKVGAALGEATEPLSFTRRRRTLSRRDSFQVSGEVGREGA